MLAVVYLLLLLSAWRGVRRLTRLESIPPIRPEAAPMVSIIVPVRNEAPTIRRTLELLLALDYPRYEVIVVDGQSTDGTAQILDELAGGRLRSVHLDALPPRWIGKSYQLHVGAQQASGEWILFTDAGVHFAPDALSRTMAYALDHQLDHLTVCPNLVMRGLAERVFLSGFFFVFLLFTRPWSARNPRSRGTIGVGPFNFIRRAAYLRAGGHEPISLQASDDVALGVHLKRQGCRQDCLYNDGSLRLRWYEGAAGLLHGLEKNTFWATRFNPLLALAAVVGLLLLTIPPYLGLFVHRIGWLRFHPWSPWVCVLSVLLLYRVFQPVTKISWVYGLLHPLAILCWCVTLLNSMWVILRRGGVLWRDRFYPLDLLKSQRAIWLRDLFF